MLTNLIKDISREQEKDVSNLYQLFRAEDYELFRKTIECAQAISINLGLDSLKKKAYVERELVKFVLRIKGYI